jgi:hypothetical protein
MVALTFPDGARREYQDGISGLDILLALVGLFLLRTPAGNLNEKTKRNDDSSSFFNRHDVPRKAPLLSWRRFQSGGYQAAYCSARASSPWLV